MICQKCRAVIADGTLICPECGGTARSSSSEQAGGGKTLGRGLSTYEIQLVRKRVLSSPIVIIGAIAYILSLLVGTLFLIIPVPGIIMLVGIFKLFSSYVSSPAEQADPSGAKMFRYALTAQKICTAITVVIAIIVAIFEFIYSGRMITAPFLIVVSVVSILIISEIIKISRRILTDEDSEDPDESDIGERWAHYLFGKLASAAKISEKRYATDLGLHDFRRCYDRIGDSRINTDDFNDDREHDDSLKLS